MRESGAGAISVRKSDVKMLSGKPIATLHVAASNEAAITYKMPKDGTCAVGAQMVLVTIFPTPIRKRAGKPLMMQYALIEITAKSATHAHAAHT
ncbi:hypothetical protein HMPREF3190_00571 [Umbribacter vaginalis]|nr:hypothetical protein HMPREF3190_00571 [Coriobacteriales bacterium DNF00809]